MNAKRKVYLDVRKEGIIASMGDQFRRADTFLTELLQNARRAGASRIDITTGAHARSVTISDDGCGIESPEVLFTVGKSGFADVESLAEEHPFGIGFAAALFAAERIRIRTLGWSCQFNTADILAGKPVMIGDGGSAKTTIRLTLRPERVRTLFGGEGIQVDILREKIEDFASGFPVPVHVNCEPVPRPYAVDGSFVTFERGRVKVDFSKGSPKSTPMVFLQGLPLSNFSGFGPASSVRKARGESACVVHLDSNAYRAQCPDRFDLVPDQVDAACAAIREAIKLQWREYLTDQKDALSGEEFSVRLGRFCPDADCSELLNDVPLPPEWYLELTEPPRQERWSSDVEDMYYGEQKPPLSVGTELFADVAEYVDLHCDRGSDGSALGLYAYLSERPILTKSLPAGHWANPVVLDERVPLVMVHGKVSEHTLQSGFGRVEVALCDSFSISIGDDLPPIERISEWCVWHPETHQLIVPAGSGYSAFQNVLLQASSYWDECDSHREEWLEADIDKLRALHALAFGGYEGVIAGLIHDQLGSICDALKGRRFQLAFDGEGRPALSAAGK